MPATVVTGDGNAGEFVRMAAAELGRELPFAPYHGTLNLEGRRGEVVEGLPNTVVTDVGDGDYCTGVELYACRIDGVLASVIVPDVPGYPADKIELLAPVHVRSLFDLTDGDAVHLDPPGTLANPAVHRINPDALGSFGAVVVDDRLYTPTTDGRGERTGSSPASRGALERLGAGVVDAVVERDPDSGHVSVERVLHCLASMDVDPGGAAFVTADRDVVPAPFSVLSANALAPK